MNGNALIVHGGAPTAVINASLYGAVKEAKKHDCIDKIYAAIGGSGAVIREQFLNMTISSPDHRQKAQRSGPGTTGTVRRGSGR